MTRYRKPLSHEPLAAESELLTSVDHLLRDFYQMEMPTPWPPLRLPAASSPPKSQYFWNLGRSYLALAASLLVFIGGLAMASGLLRDGPAYHVSPSYRTPGEARKNDDPGKPKPPTNPGGSSGAGERQPLPWPQE